MDQIKPEENLARYILCKDHFNTQQKKVKYVVYMPALNGETSVFRISNLSEDEIWEIGNCKVAQKRELPLLGRADILASCVMDRNLKLIPDNNPPRHANIVGWPEEKSKQKLIAMELAENAQLRLK